MTRQQMAQRWFKASLFFLAFILIVFFNQKIFHPQREDLLEEVKSRPAPSAEEHLLSLKHIGGMRQHDTFYLHLHEL